ISTAQPRLTKGCRKTHGAHGAGVLETALDRRLSISTSLPANAIPDAKAIPVPVRAKTASKACRSIPPVASRRPALATSKIAAQRARRSSAIGAAIRSERAASAIAASAACQRLDAELGTALRTEPGTEEDDGTGAREV